MEWEPITLDGLNDLIKSGEVQLNAEMFRFWKLVKINPEKWAEPEFDNGDDEFWVVGIFGKKIIWYNDIEEGFNVSDYITYGTIEMGEFGGGEQDELHWCLNKVFKIK